MSRNFLDSEMSRVTIKWDISTEKAKAMLKDLGVGFLPIDSQTTAKENELHLLSTCLTPTLKAVSLSNKKCRCGQELPSDAEKEYLNIEDLSDEIMLRVFKFLPKPLIAGICALVCKRWNRIAFDPSLWKKTDLRGKQLTGHQLRCVLQRQVMYVRLADVTVNENIIFTKPLKIHYLDLSMAHITVELLNSILSSCEKSLVKLSLESLNINETTIDLLSEQKELNVLNLTLCRFTNSKKEFRSKLPVTLKELDASWIDDLVVSTLIRALPVNIQRLNLSGYRKHFTDNDVDYLTIKCLGIRELNISDCTHLTTQAMQFISIRLKNLEHIHISRCYGIVFDDFSKCKSLKTISTFGLSPATIISENNVEINKHPFSSIARPTFGNRRSFMWEIKMD